MSTPVLREAVFKKLAYIRANAVFPQLQSVSQSLLNLINF
jgi:hypothetical protein